jgi:HEAT repeat protein
MTEAEPVDAAAGAEGSIGRRREAAEAGHAGDPAGARPYLHDGDPAVRSSALRALERAGDLAAGELEAALEDPAPAVRLTALELAARRDDISGAAVADRLVDDDRRVVEAAAWACGEKVSAGRTDISGSGTAAVVDALAQVARSHDDPLCRESAIAALGAISDPAGLPAVLAGLDDKPEVRRRAVIALAPFDGPEVDAALLRATTDRDRQVRTAAAELRSA